MIVVPSPGYAGPAKVAVHSGERPVMAMLAAPYSAVNVEHPAEFVVLATTVRELPLYRALETVTSSATGGVTVFGAIDANTGIDLVYPPRTGGGAPIVGMFGIANR